jgi:hypothetical protein
MSVSVLSQFRDHLEADARATPLPETTPARAGEAGPTRARSRIRTDSTHVLARIRSSNPPERVAESLRSA